MLFFLRWVSMTLGTGIKPVTFDLSRPTCPGSAHRCQRSGVYSQNTPWASPSTFRKYTCGCNVCVDSLRSSMADRTSVFLLMLTGPSPLPLHWRRRFCLEVNEAWPLIDHVWSCTTLLISACSSLVCLFCSTVPTITPTISCMIC